MSLRTLRTGATAIPEDNVLQTITDMVAASGISSKASGSHFTVQQQSTPDMTIKVKAGRAYIKEDSGNAYPVILDSDTSVAVGANSSGSTRIDSIVLYIDKAASANTDASNIAKLITVQGNASAPTDGAIQTAVSAGNPYLRLANVSVSNGATSIVTANITDKRVPVRFQLSDVSFYDGGSLDYGWGLINESWTFQSTTGTPERVSVTTSDGAELRFQKGDKIRLKQGGSYKYFFIIGNPNTNTLVLCGGTDYVVANSAITDIYVSRANNPFGFPADLWLSADGKQRMSFIGQKMIIRGWGRVVGTNADRNATNVTFAVPFVSGIHPHVEVGALSEGDGTSLTSFNTSVSNKITILFGDAISSTGFNAVIEQKATGSANGVGIGFTYIASGGV
jgi:hypothetical protein